MKHQSNLSVVLLLLAAIAIACGRETGSGPATAHDPNEKPIAIAATSLTKEYDGNELAADGKYKGKLVAVSGKITDIADTFGNVTVQLEGHDIVHTVMCNFNDAERSNVAKLTKGQQVTLTGRVEGSTAGLYVGLQKCTAG